MYLSPFMRNFVFSLLLLIPCLAPAATEVPLTRTQLIDKIVAQGVPRRGIEKLFEFRDRNLGVPFITEIYKCAGAPEGDVRACGSRSRISAVKIVTVLEQPYAVYIDFKRPSTQKRLWLIDMKNGAAEAQLVAHGSGSGIEAAPQRFSNRRDSQMTSLGMYIAGDTYRSGNHGTVMRLHGLDWSNNNAYVRDVIFHGAKYATESYLEKKDEIGESAGCPAVSDEFAQRSIPLLKNGALVFHDHEDLLDLAMSGEEVGEPAPKSEARKPSPRPKIKKNKSKKRKR